MTKLITLALLAASFAAAETITFNGTAHQDSINTNYVFNGSFSIPNNPTVVGLGDVSNFDVTLYDIQASYNPAYAYATYNITQDDLQSFSMTFDVQGNPTAWSLQAIGGDGSNMGGILNVDWPQDGPDGFAGGGAIFNLSFAVQGAHVTPEPVSLALVGLGLVGIWGVRRKWQAKDR